MLHGLSGYYVPGGGGGVPVNDAVLPRYSAIGRVGGCGCRGVGQSGEQYKTMTAGHVAFAGAGGILIGMLFMHIWKERKA
jgi:hypothetical protein